MALALALTGVAGAAGDEVSLLRIQVTDGEGWVQRCGARAQRPLAVRVTDENGRPVAGATVSFQMPEQGPGGVFSNGLETLVIPTDAAGAALAGGIRWNSTPGSVMLRVTAAKAGARAGTGIFVYLSNGAVTRRPGHGLKWTAAILLGAGAAGGAVYGARARVKSQAAPAAPQAVPLSIGAPAVTIGKP